MRIGSVLGDSLRWLLIIDCGGDGDGYDGMIPSTQGHHGPYLCISFEDPSQQRSYY